MDLYKYFIFDFYFKSFIIIALCLPTHCSRYFNFNLILVLVNKILTLPFLYPLLKE